MNPAQITLEVLFSILNHEKAEVEGYKEGPIQTPFKITPQEYLLFSEADLISNSGHKYINALSNAKRSLDCQVDTLLTGFGFYKLSKDKNWGFPKKLQLLNELGIIVPRVLSKINRTRNLMEHEFIVPDAEKVEDFIDIVALFLAATDIYTLKFMYIKNIFLDHKQFDISSLTITVLYKENKILIETFKFTNDLKVRIESAWEITPKDDKYVEVLKAFLKVQLR